MTHPQPTGRKVGRTIYLQLGDEPSDRDQLIGVMDTPELAAQAVDAIASCRAIFALIGSATAKLGLNLGGRGAEHCLAEIRKALDDG